MLQQNEPPQQNRPHTTLDAVLQDNLRDLERLAEIYYARGDFDRAKELQATVQKFRQQQQRHQHGK
jgi:hypothetical protein